MRTQILATLLALASPLPPVAADPVSPVVLVELYTSQGCSNCPPADEMIAELAQRDDVLPLALHVDYWDYIGWADSFADPRHTDRQKAYARVARSRSLYTPQLVVGGVDQVNGFKPMRLVDLIARHRSEGAPAGIVAETEGDVVRLHSRPGAGALVAGDVNVDLVRFAETRTVEILHGENAGKTITYANIVTGWERVGRWDGLGEFAFTPEVRQDGALAVVVQAEGPGEVLAAFRLR
ncbi:MAG: DUF1223 domain-containing protein [Rhodobacterales bacterium]|nr:MAG: DUF1223 domain-containing protein [Rhodobacterales bacterium]